MIKNKKTVITAPYGLMSKWSKLACSDVTFESKPAFGIQNMLNTHNWNILRIVNCAIHFKAETQKLNI